MSLYIIIIIIVNTSSVIRLWSVHYFQRSLKLLGQSKPNWPIESKFHVEPPLVWISEIYRRIKDINDNLSYDFDGAIPQGKMIHV